MTGKQCIDQQAGGWDLTSNHLEHTVGFYHLSKVQMQQDATRSKDVFLLWHPIPLRHNLCSAPICAVIGPPGFPHTCPVPA